MSAQQHLAQYGVSVQVAKDFIMSNLDSLGTIYNTCQQFGVNNDMIAEILDINGVDGQFVSSFFTSNGLNGDALGFDTATELTQTEEFLSQYAGTWDMTGLELLNIGEYYGDSSLGSSYFSLNENGNFVSYIDGAGSLSGTITEVTDNYIRGTVNGTFEASYAINGNQIYVVTDDFVINGYYGDVKAYYDIA